MRIETMLVVSVAVTLALVVLLYIFILPDRRRRALNGFFRVVHDFLNVKYLILETIFRFAYVFTTIFLIVFGTFMLFDEPLAGLGFIFLGPIAARIVFEIFMLGVLLVKNVIEINNHLKNIDRGGDGHSTSRGGNYGSGYGETTRKPRPAPEPPKPKCVNCGRPLIPGSTFCGFCGSPVEETGGAVQMYPSDTSFS